MTGFDLDVGLGAVHHQPEVGCSAVEPRGLVLPGNPPLLVEPSRPAGLQLAAEGGALVLRDDGSLLWVQGVKSHGGHPPIQRGGGILPEKPLLMDDN